MKQGRKMFGQENQMTELRDLLVQSMNLAFIILNNVTLPHDFTKRLCLADILLSQISLKTLERKKLSGRCSFLLPYKIELSV